jgi:hypothetical protein
MQSESLSGLKIPDMKVFSCVLVLFLAGFPGCKKNLSNLQATGVWNLVQENLNIAGGSSVLVPRADSSVELILLPNFNYQTELSGKIVAAGSYAINPDVSNSVQNVLQLYNFKKTGIFALFTVYEIATSGQVLSAYDEMFMTIRNDSMTLSSGITPGGWISYTFARN